MQLIDLVCVVAFYIDIFNLLSVAVSPSRGASSRYTGVRWHKGNRKWVAEIRYDGRQHALGYFDDEQEAATLVQSAWRGAAARRQQLLSEGAAISIQASWRAKNARKALAELRAMGMSEGDIRWMIREVPATRATVCLAGLRV